MNEEAILSHVEVARDEVRNAMRGLEREWGLDDDRLLYLAHAVDLITAVLSNNGYEGCDATKW